MSGTYRAVCGLSQMPSPSLFVVGAHPARQTASDEARWQRVGRRSLAGTLRAGGPGVLLEQENSFRQTVGEPPAFDPLLEAIVGSSRFESGATSFPKASRP